MQYTVVHLFIVPIRMKICPTALTVKLIALLTTSPGEIETMSCFILWISSIFIRIFHKHDTWEQSRKVQ